MQEFIANPKQAHYDKVKKIYTAECSSLGLRPGQVPGKIKVNTKTFIFDRLDTSGSGEDVEVAGWLYMEDNDKVAIWDRTRFLLIND